MHVFTWLLLLGLASAAGKIRAEVTLAPLFGDHAVLQRDKPVPIWGRADPGEKITVAFLDREVRTTTGADGRWLVFLEAVGTLREGSDLVVTGKNTITLHDIVVGEVWLCGGAEGMKLPLVAVRNAGDTLARTNLPLLRQIKIDETFADSPADSVRTDGWQMATSPAVAEFSSTGFFFAREIFQKLGVPVGLIEIATASAPPEAWMSPAALANNPAATVASALRLQRPGEKPAEGLAPASRFNGMLNPLLPYALRGALWQETTDSAVYFEGYRSLFPAMITAWREHFGQGDFPFYWVQVAGRRATTDRRHPGLAYFREAQAPALELPNTGQAVIIDLGEEKDLSNLEDQQVVARRLALLAKNRTYGMVADDSGPRFVSAVREGNAMRVRLAHSTAGLVAHEKPVQSLELAGADQVFRPATAKLERETLLVTSPEVKMPVAVRYAWRDAPEVNLYSGAGLPVTPFRSDDW